MRVIGLCVPILAAAFACSQGTSSSPSVATGVPSAPTPAQPRVDIPGYDQRWQLTTLVTNSSACANGGRPLPGVGMRMSCEMAIARSGSTLKALYCVQNYPTDHIDYTGTVQGDELVAQMVPIPDVPLCAGSATLEGRVVGLFSKSGRHLDATEVDSYHLSSGDMQVTFSWSADLE